MAREDQGRARAHLTGSKRSDIRRERLHAMMHVMTAKHYFGKCIYRLRREPMPFHMPSPAQRDEVRGADGGNT